MTLNVRNTALFGLEISVNGDKLEKKPTWNSKTQPWPGISEGLLGLKLEPGDGDVVWLVFMTT